MFVIQILKISMGRNFPVIVLFLSESDCIRVKLLLAAVSFIRVDDEKFFRVPRRSSLEKIHLSGMPWVTRAMGLTPRAARARELVPKTLLSSDQSLLGSHTVNMYVPPLPQLSY